MKIRSRRRYETSARHQSLDKTLRLEETGFDLRDVPASRTHTTGEHNADPAGLTHAHEPAGVLRIELARHAEPQRGLSQVVLRDVCEEHAPQLEKRRASRPEGPVTGRGVEQPRQHTGSQKAAFGAKGVLQPDGPVIQAEVIRPALGAERVGNSLREPEIREQTPEHTRLSLRYSKRPGLGNGRQPLWHSVEPDEPSDLLDEVCLPAEIPPEGGNGSPQPSVLPLDLATQGLQTSGRVIHLNGHAEQELGPAEPQRYTPGLDGLGVVAEGIIGGRSTRILREQGTHTVHRVRHHVRIEATLEAAGG